MGKQTGLKKEGRKTFTAMGLSLGDDKLCRKLYEEGSMAAWSC